MQEGHVEALENAAAVTYGWLKEIESELGWDDRRLALRALRGVLHALRDELTIEQSAHLSAQLPVLIRGMYYEGWKPGESPARDRRLSAFLERVRPAMTGYIDEAGLYEISRAVLGVLERHVSAGEVTKVRNALPKGLQELFV